MTTPTLQIAESVGLVEDDYFGRSHFNELTEAKLQAFREAVEAESDAERMKQPAFGYVTKYTKKFLSLDQAIDGHYSADSVDTVYAQPFPSTEQLQQRVKELQEALLKVDDAAIECEGEDGELVFSVDADTIHAVRELLDPILANTQGDEK